MKLVKIYCVTLIIFIISILFFTTCKKEDPTLTVSPANLIFTANDTEEKIFTINTDATSWSYNNPSHDWVDAYKKNDNRLYVKVSNNSNTNNSRNATLTITAGKATPVEVTVEQFAQEVNTLTASPTSISFNGNETGDRSVSVTTNASSWDAVTNAQWISLSKQDRILVVTVAVANTQATARTSDIIITAGTAPPFIVTVLQSAGSAPDPNQIPITTTYNYTSTSVPLFEFDEPELNEPSWTGRIVPHTTSSVSFIEITNFGNFGAIAPQYSLSVYCDFIGGKFRIDATSPIAIDQTDGTELYFCMGSVDVKAQLLTLHFGVNFEINYNPTTKVLDFTNTYNGLPTCYTIAIKENGQWSQDYIASNAYANLKFQLTSTSSVPFIGNDDSFNQAVADFELKKPAPAITKVSYRRLASDKNIKFHKLIQ